MVALLLGRCTTRHNERPIVEAEALKLSILASDVTSIACHNFSVSALVKSVTNFSAALEKEHCVCFLAARMGDIVGKILLFHFLSGSRAQTYHCYVQVVTFLHKCTNNLNIIENIDGEKTGSKTLCILHLNDEILLSSWIEKEPLLVRAICQYIRNQMRHNPVHALSFNKSGKVY